MANSSLRRDLVAELDYFPLELAEQKRDQLAAIRDKMVDAGYNDSFVTEVLGVGYSSVTSMGWQAIAERYFLDSGNPTHSLIRLFCLNLPEREQALAGLFNADELSLLRDLRLLERIDPETVLAPVALWPLSDLFIATDHYFEPDPIALDEPNRVMDLGGDSVSLALMVRDARANSALDLCTGSGGVALLASRSCGRVTGIDINPRAINFARFNTILNAVENCSFVEGDLYEPIGPEKFDLVTANPPYIPSPPADSILYRDGGTSGEQVLSRVIGGCFEHLTTSGVCVVVTSLVEHAGVSYEDKVRRWLGVDAGFSTLVLQGPGRSPYEFAQTDNIYDPSSEASFQALYEWLDNCRHEQIDQIHLGYLVLKRKSTDELPVRQLPIPGFFDHSADFDDFLNSLLDRLASLDDTGSQDRRSTPTFDANNAAVIIEQGLVGGLHVPYPLYRCLDALANDGITLERVVELLGERGYAVSSEEREKLRAFLEYLVLMGYLKV